MLEVINKNELLVVDSRLISEELGIDHKTLKSTITKYSNSLIELGSLDIKAPAVGSATGLLIKETASRNTDGSGGEVYYLLTETQANFVMSLSQNTEPVVKAKLNLVKAFNTAKQTITKSALLVSTDLTNMFQTIQQEMKVLSARTQKLDILEKAASDNKGIKGVLDSKMEDTFSNDLQFTTREYLEYKGVSLVHLNTLRKRAITFYKQGIQSEDLPKKGSEVLFVGAAVAYLEEALKTILF